VLFGLIFRALASCGWRDFGGRKWLALSLVGFFLALLAKETAVVLPAMILFYEWSRRGGSEPEPRLRRTVLVVAPMLPWIWRISPCVPSR